MNTAEASITEFIHFKAKFVSLEDDVPSQRLMTSPQGQGLLHCNVLVLKIQTLQLVIQVLNYWINFEKF
jgi:hypothetical protein